MMKRSLKQAVESFIREEVQIEAQEELNAVNNLVDQAASEFGLDLEEDRILLQALEKLVAKILIEELEKTFRRFYEY